MTPTAHKIPTVNIMNRFRSTIPVCVCSAIVFLLFVHHHFCEFSDPSKQKWVNHKGVQKLDEVLNLKETCGYITFIKTGVRDIGCENYDINVHLTKAKGSVAAKEERRQKSNPVPPTHLNYVVSDICAILQLGIELECQFSNNHFYMK